MLGVKFNEYEHFPPIKVSGRGSGYKFKLFNLAL